MGEKSGGKTEYCIARMALLLSGLVLKYGISTVNGTLNKTTTYKLQKVSPMTNETGLYDALKYRVVVDNVGDRNYYNHAGQLHRDEGPAVEWHDGVKFWYQNGKLHREDGPAVIWRNGAKYWYLTHLRKSFQLSSKSKMEVRLF
jgi:hypothetical protein